MKKPLTLVIAVIMMISLTACGKNDDAIVEQTNETQPIKELTEAPESEQKDWEYDALTHTLYVNVDMGEFEPDAPDFDGTASNAPWAEYLQKIENIVVGDGVTRIGEYAFAFCSNLKSVEVGKNVTALDFRCFFKCGDFDNDLSIDMHFNSTPEFGEDVFGYTWDNPNVVIYVPDDMKEYWAEFIMQKGEMILDGYDMIQPIGKDDVLFAMLMNPHELWAEGSAGFSENNGGEFGAALKKVYNSDAQRLEIYGEDTGDCVKFNTSLKTCMSDVGMGPVAQQAVIVKFSASDISNGARISFDALDEIDFWFGDDGVKFVDMANFFEMPITDFMPNNLELKDDTINYFFFAFDGEGNIRMFIWEEGFSENQAYFEYDLYQEAEDINNSDLIMHLAIGANSQFNLYEYWVYTFDNYMEGLPPYIITEENQNDDMQNSDNDYGPSWNINIAGNFDIMSDMVWQSVEVRALEINSDIYVGYNLAEMMNFSGNGQDNAMIVFGEQGVDGVEVNPTSDAYIVFKKSDEFLGGPFLLYDNELYEYPVIEVKTEY